MVKSLSYRNKKIDRDIIFEFENTKKIIAIYGKNGVGKTSFSLSSFWDEKYVFNEMFIRKNIYITSDDGVQSSTKNNQNLSLLFMGDDIIKLQNKLEKLGTNLREYKDIHKNNLNEIQSNFSSRIDSSLLSAQFELYTNQITGIDPYISYDKLEEDITDEIIVKTNITKMNDFLEKRRLYDNQDKVQLFLKLIQQNGILTSIFITENVLGKYYDLIDSINSLEGLHRQKKLVDDFYKERGVNAVPNSKFIADLLKLQGSNKDCVICGSIGTSSEVTRWKNVLDNEFKKEKTKILEKLENIIKVVTNIEVIKEQLIDEIPKTLMFLKSINQEVEEIKEKLVNDDLIIVSKLTMVELEDITLETSNLLMELITFLISTNKMNYIGTIYQIDNINNEITNVKTHLNTLMDVQKNTIMADMNKILARMQVDRTIQVNINRSGGNYKYKYTVDGKEVSILSEGQRHKLALAFFIVSIKLLGLNNKTIVFDDPVISLDELGYHILKQLIIDLRKIDDSVSVVVLTHNIFYLYIQLSNVFLNDELRKITSFYRMTESEVKEFELDILRLDDISLFKKCISRVNSEDELLIISGIIPKIFRHMLDLNIRMKGLFYLDKPSEDIEHLDLTDEDKEELLRINKSINKISKKVKIFDSTKSILLLEEIEKATTLLGFDKYVTNEDVERLSLFCGDKLILEQLSSDDLIFDMVDAVNDILYRDIMPELRAYIAHPRQQITKQITSLSSDF